MMRKEEKIYSSEQPIFVNIGEGESDLNFSSDSKLLISSSSYGKVINVWNVAGSLIKKIKLPYRGPLSLNGIRGIVISPTEKIISGNYSCVQQWSIQSGALEKEYSDITGHVASLNYSDNIMIGFNFSYIGISSLKNDNIALQNSFPTPSTVCCAVSSYGPDPYIVSGHEDKAIRIWDIRGCLFKTLVGHNDWVRSVAISPNGKLIASGGGADDLTLRIWDMEAGCLLQTFYGKHSNRILSVLFTPDNEYVISASETETCISKVLSEKSAPIANIGSQSLAISPNGQYLATGSPNGLVIYNLPGIIKGFEEVNKEKQQKEKEEKGKGGEIRRKHYESLTNSFLELIEYPERLSYGVLDDMFEKVENIEEFKLPYTLACIAKREEIIINVQTLSKINRKVYERLNNLAVNCVCPEGMDQKQSSRLGAFNIAIYKAALKSAFKNGFINETQRDILASLAEDNKTFSDDRFKSIERDIKLLKEQVDLHRKSIQAIRGSLSNLEKALSKKERLAAKMGLAKIAFSFVVAVAPPLAIAYGFLPGDLGKVFDLSDVELIKESIFSKEALKFIEQQGENYIKEGQLVEDIAKKLGHDPDEAVVAWAQSIILLESSSLREDKAVSSLRTPVYSEQHILNQSQFEVISPVHSHYSGSISLLPSASGILTSPDPLAEARRRNAEARRRRAEARRRAGMQSVSPPAPTHDTGSKIPLAHHSVAQAHSFSPSPISKIISPPNLVEEKTSIQLASSSSITSITKSSIPGAQLASFAFFPPHKPAVIKNETPSELEKCMNKFQELFDDHSYTFTVKRASKEQLVLQFTAEQDVVEDSKEIKKQLQPAAIKLRQLVNASGLNIKSKQCKLDWNAWTLTIDATSDEIEGIAWLLQTASGKYIIKDNKPSDHETTCHLQ